MKNNYNYNYKYLQWSTYYFYKSFFWLKICSVVKCNCYKHVIFINTTTYHWCKLKAGNGTCIIKV